MQRGGEEAGRQRHNARSLGAWPPICPLPLHVLDGRSVGRVVLPLRVHVLIAVAVGVDDLLRVLHVAVVLCVLHVVLWVLHMVLWVVDEVWLVLQVRRV